MKNIFIPEEGLYYIPMIAIFLPMIIAVFLLTYKSKFIKIKKIITITSLTAIFSTLVFLTTIIVANNRTIVSFLINPIGMGLSVDILAIIFGDLILLLMILLSIFSYRIIKDENEVSSFYGLILLVTSLILWYIFSGDILSIFFSLEIVMVLLLKIKGKKLYLKNIKLMKNFRNLTKVNIEEILKSFGSSILIFLAIIMLILETKSVNFALISSVISDKGKLSFLSVAAVSFIIIGYGIDLFKNGYLIFIRSKDENFKYKYCNIFSLIISIALIYGIIRLIIMILGLSNYKSLGILIIIYGVVLSVFGTIKAIMERELFRRIAFHSLAQIGLILISLSIGILENGTISAMSFIGTMFHMINFLIFMSLITFIIYGVYYTTGISNIDKLGALGKRMPLTMIAFLFSCCAIGGVPLFNGFSSMRIIFETGFKSTFSIITIVELIISIITLGSFITMSYSIFFRRIEYKENVIKEVPLSMKIPFIVLTTLIFIVGAIPNFIVQGIMVPMAQGLVNIDSYVFSTIGYNSAIKTYNPKFQSYNFENIGIFEPLQLLVIFILFFITVIALMMFRGKNTGEELRDGHDSVFDLIIYQKYRDELKFNKKKSQAKFTDGCKYDVFVGGEDLKSEVFSKGEIYRNINFRNNKIFNIIEIIKIRVNSRYSLYIVLFIVLITIYLFIFR